MRNIYEIYIEGEGFLTYSYRPSMAKYRIKKMRPNKKFRIVEVTTESPDYREKMVQLTKKIQRRKEKLFRYKRIGFIPSDYVLDYANTFDFIKNEEEKDLLIKTLHEAESWERSTRK